MTSQKTMLKIEVHTRRSMLYWPLFVYACVLCSFYKPVPDWLINRLFDFYIGDPPVSWIQRKWRKSKLARRLDRFAIRSQLAASRRVWYNRIVPMETYLFCRREEERLYDELDATYR